MTGTQGTCAPCPGELEYVGELLTVVGRAESPAVGP